MGDNLKKYIGNWKILIDKEIKKGNEIKDILEDTSIKTNINNMINDREFIKVIKIIENKWIYGKQIKEWYLENYNN